jgi:hypothetical protein
VQDFYLASYLPPPPPPFENLLDEARAAPRVPERLAELEALVPWTASITARLGEPIERESL